MIRRLLDRMSICRFGTALEQIGRLLDRVLAAVPIPGAP